MKRPLGWHAVWIPLLPILVFVVCAGSPTRGADFVNFETPHVHPIDLSPDRNTLAVVNTAAHRLELFDVASGEPKRMAAVSVGLDPVSVRFRSDDEAWVVNQISDSVSVVDVPTRRVRATLQTGDEPADIVFAGSPQRAFVSCSAVDLVQVFDPDEPGRKPKRVKIGAEEPRAMAVSADGGTVWVAIFESGNRSTVLAGGFDVTGIGSAPTVPANVVSDPSGPYGGQNPPPNRGTAFDPPIAAHLPDPPPVALIVKKNAGDRWLDDNGGDWTDFVSGPRAGLTHRRPGWDVVDRDVAAIDAGSLAVRYVEGLMNANMALVVRPGDGRVTVVGTEATNEVRFEPNLNGVFLRVNLALVDPATGSSSLVDLNPHLTYETPRIAQGERRRSLGDPRAIVWTADGELGFVAGMGSNNLVTIDAQGRRSGEAPIRVGKGPTGLVLDEELGRLYVLDRFSATVSVVDIESRGRIGRVKLRDPTPKAIRKGRTHLYDTHRTSGLGHVSCASCHIDARTDRLAWDLGNPAGELKSSEGQNRTLVPGDSFADWHPMKGPMATQTLQDIIGKEPHHWRGDRDGLEEFAGAFRDLMGDDAPLADRKMKQLEDFLATIHFPPNPFRGFDNSLSTSVSLKGHYRSGRFGREGRSLPRGNSRRGLELFRSRGVGLGLSCSVCHVLPTGAGTPAARQGLGFSPIPPGPNGEQHLALIGEDFSEQLGIKIPQLRNAYDKVGMEFTRAKSRSGIGFFHDGSIDSLARFVSAEIFDLASDQEVADVVAFLLSISGSGFERRPGDPPGAPSQDAHAAVGRQATVSGPGEQRQLIGAMVALAAEDAVDLVVKGVAGGSERGWRYASSSGRFQPAQPGRPALGLADLLELARPGGELTFTVVPKGSGFLGAPGR